VRLSPYLPRLERPAESNTPREGRGGGILTSSIKQDGELLIGRPGDVVFVPEGANYSSLKNPFKAFLCVHCHCALSSMLAP
jgi:hypothetical protein